MTAAEVLRPLAGAHVRLAGQTDGRGKSGHRRHKNPHTPNRWMPSPDATALGIEVDKAYERRGCSDEQFAAAGGMGTTKAYRVRNGHFRWVNALIREACRFWGVEVPAHMQGPGQYDCYQSIPKH